MHFPPEKLSSAKGTVTDSREHSQPECGKGEGVTLGGHLVVVVVVIGVIEGKEFRSALKSAFRTSAQRSEEGDEDDGLACPHR